MAIAAHHDDQLGNEKTSFTFHQSSNHSSNFFFNVLDIESLEEDSVEYPSERSLEKLSVIAADISKWNITVYSNTINLQLSSRPLHQLIRVYRI
jgi:hypothetical protein